MEHFFAFFCDSVDVCHRIVPSRIKSYPTFCGESFIWWSSVSCFPNFLVYWQSKRAKQILRHTSHMNLFILIASSIRGDSEKGGDLFFYEDHFSGQHNTISDVIDHYFIAAFTQFWLKT